MRVKDASKWQLKLESMTLKQLFRLHEMAQLTQSIGQGEESIKSLDIPNDLSDSVHSINTDRSQERIDLGHQIWRQIQRVSQRTFHQDAHDPSVYAKHEGFMWFVVFWDHWQESLKDLVCHQSTISPAMRPSPEFERQYLWDDSSDEGQQE